MLIVEHAKIYILSGENNLDFGSMCRNKIKGDDRETQDIEEMAIDFRHLCCRNRVLSQAVREVPKSVATRNI